MDAALRKLIGERLAEARRVANFKQSEIAERVGVAEPTLQSWERGDRVPNAEKLRRLCMAYRVSAQYILGLSDHPTGLPIGAFVVNLQALERAEQARSKDEVKELWFDGGLVFGYRIPERPVVVLDEDEVEVRARIKRVQQRLLGGDDGGPARGETAEG